MITWILIAALFIIAQTQDPPGYPSVSGKIRTPPENVVLVALKRNELSSSDKTWKNLTCL